MQTCAPRERCRHGAPLSRRDDGLDSIAALRTMQSDERQCWTSVQACRCSIMSLLRVHSLQPHACILREQLRQRILLLQSASPLACRVPLCSDHGASVEEMVRAAMQMTCEDLRALIDAVTPTLSVDSRSLLLLLAALAAVRFPPSLAQLKKISVRFDSWDPAAKGVKSVTRADSLTHALHGCSQHLLAAVSSVSHRILSLSPRVQRFLVSSVQQSPAQVQPEVHRGADTRLRPIATDGRIHFQERSSVEADRTHSRSRVQLTSCSFGDAVTVLSLQTNGCSPPLDAATMRF